MSAPEILDRFQTGELLIVQPGDEDDPEANALKGATCTFVRYVPHTGHCVMQVEGRRRPLYLRPTDLVRKPKAEVQP